MTVQKIGKILEQFFFLQKSNKHLENFQPWREFDLTLSKGESINDVNRREIRDVAF